MINLHEWCKQMVDDLLVNKVYAESISIDMECPNASNIFAPIYNQVVVCVTMRLFSDNPTAIKDALDESFQELFELSRVSLDFEYDTSVYAPSFSHANVRFYQEAPKWDWVEA